MKTTSKTHGIAYLLLCLILLSSCGSNTKLENTPDPVSIAFGTDATFDVATWNLREFPLRGSATLDHLAHLIPQLKLELIALQEINNHSAMIELADMIPHYNTYISDGTTSWRLAYLYDTRSVSVLDTYTIFNGQTNPFPRPPYVMKLNWRGEEMYVINNHLKALGGEANEARRRLACELLEQYIDEYLPDQRVIVLGDMNDEIQEEPDTNVFMAFLNKPENYLFTTMSIAQNINYYTASYPTWPSQIDHILITNELFEPFSNSGSFCHTILIENAMGSWSSYSTYVSDHRPVGARFKFEP